MNILLTNHFLTNFTGSEVACLDLVQALQDRGHQVTLACFEQGEPLLSELQRQRITPVALSELTGQHYDLIWAHHFTTLEYALFELDITAKRIIYSSLSPYESLESPPLCSERVNLFLANSPETQATLLGMGLIADQVRLFANPVAEAFFAYQPPVFSAPQVYPPLIKLALVSNHIPRELSAALPLLAKLGVQVTVFGLEGQQRLITADLLSDFNGIISIGRTVQYGLAMGLPVFCYDHFAGPGWLTEENVEHAADHNFAGRCTPERQSPKQLVTAIVNGFYPAQQAARVLRPFAKARYQLSEQLTRVLQYVANCSPYALSARCYQAIARRQRRYWQQSVPQQPSLYVGVYGDVGQGFSERFSLQREIEPPYQQVKLNIELSDLGLLGQLQVLRIDPLNLPCVVRLQRVALLDNTQRLHLVTERIASNALFCEGQDYYFMSNDGQWWFSLDIAELLEWHSLVIEFDIIATEQEALEHCQSQVVAHQQAAARQQAEHQQAAARQQAEHQQAAASQQAEQQQQFQRLAWQHDQQQQKAEHLNDALQQMRQHPIWRSLRALRQLRDRIFGLLSNNNQ